MPQTGHFILHSNVMPKITAGRYELRTEQTGLPFEVEPETTHIQVAAPRYTMPTDQILSSFPPANAEGAFGDRLPQIVLKRRTLPWERNPAGVVTTSETPWLALVVVAEGEATLSTATPVRDCVTPGTALLDPDDKDVEQGLYLAVTETVVKKVFPCKDDLPLLAHVREVDVNDTELANGDDDGWLAVVLANRLPVFDEAAKKPVRYMACLVNLEGQLDALPPPLPPVPSFEFVLAQDWSVLATVNAASPPDARVMGNVSLGDMVLPSAALGPASARPEGLAAAALNKTAAGAKIGVALDGSSAMQQPSVGKQWTSATQKVAAVALDPDAKRLVRDTMAQGFRLPIELYAIEKVLRFPVLAHWSFTTNEGATFETLMQDLDVGLLGTVPERAPNAPAANAAPEVVQTGHIGLDHRTRRGDPTRAWYRGPCVPFPTPRDSTAKDEPLALAHSADQLRRVIPDGREDLSLAAAFEIGRLMALSQLSVVSALLRFRAEQFGAGRVREILAELMPFAIPSLAELRDARIDMGRFVALQVLPVVAKNTDRMIGPQRPVADPGRPLRVEGDLDRLVAAGLGFDLAALRKRADSVGVLSALQTTAVPLAMKPGETPNEKLVVPALRAALQGELQRTLAVAVPSKPTVVTRPGVRGAQARPQRDALDELIAHAPPDDDEEAQP
ncbi:MAG: hypothetical protein AB7U92_03520 [Piscinibacter sp.]|uniref:hypothetical protein n=1 Tax=Piscinibacter sp. TaxID=1903157 RepID=UPI003D0D9514